MPVVAVTSENFTEEVTNAAVPVLVDFWAPTCGPCRMLNPILDEIAKEQEGVVKICNVNTNDNIELAMKFNITAIPALLIFKNGRVVEQILGVQPKQRIVDALLD